MANVTTDQYFPSVALSSGTVAINGVSEDVVVTSGNVATTMTISLGTPADKTT